MKNFTLFIIMLISAVQIWAGDTEYSLRRDRIQIQDNDVFKIDFPYTPEYGTWDGLRHEGKLKLEYNRESFTDITWTNDWRYHIVFQYWDGGGYSDSDTLSISYETGNYVYSDYALFYDHTSFDQRKIKIIEVIGEYYDAGWQTAVNPDTDANIPSDIHIELCVKTQRYYELDETEETSLTFNSLTNVADWFFVHGAESYDLEWVFIDSSSSEYQVIKDTIDYANNVTYGPGEDFGDYFVMDYVFEIKEPTRINTTFTYYEIDRIYPRGLLFFRVRPVGAYTGTDNPDDDYVSVKTGKWSYFHSPSTGINSYNNLAFMEISTSVAFEIDQSWLYGVNFAEDGKSVSALTYFDGSLRGRQSLVYNTSDDITLVGENKFDYEGRQTISILPAPVDGRTFIYQDDFNQDMAGNPFEKDDFDKANPDSLKQDPSGTKGAAQYYSPYNTFTQNEYRKSTPVADGFVYSQVRYNRDATGRVSEVAGVGETFAMENGHTTKYFYSTAKEVELRRLFGDEVGYADNYKKTIVVDPNGQGTATYKDNHGRTIATAVVGPTPENLKELDGTSSGVLTTPLSVSNLIDNEFETKSIESFPHLGDTVNYSFSYNFNGVLYGTENPYDTTEVICQDCIYDFYFHLEDPDGDTISNSYKHYTFSASTISCNGEGVTTYVPSNDPGTNLGTYQIIEPGDYKVYKHLVVNTGDLVDSLYAQADSALGGIGPFIDSILADVDISGCFTNCDTFCLYYSELSYEDETGLDWDALSGANQQAYIDTCMMENCELDSLWDGEYGDIYDNDSLDQNIAIGAVAQCSGIYQGMAQQIQPGGAFYDDINLDTLFWDEIEEDIGYGGLLLYPDYEPNGTPIGTPITSISTIQDPAQFQEEWIDSLIFYHREYCHYKVCVDLYNTTNSDGESSLEFDFMINFKGPWPGTPNISDYVSATYSKEPLIGSTIEDTVLASTGYTWLNMIDDDYDEPCTGNSASMAIDLYTDSLWICFNGSGSLSEQDSIDKWNMFTGNYNNKKNQYINYYKAYIDSLIDTTHTYYQIQGCLYYDDGYNIVFDPVIDEDSLTDSTFVANLFTNVQQNNGNGTVLSFNCGDQCNTNVPFWLNSFSDTCETILLDNDSLLYYELETLFYDYCLSSCLTGNVGGWLYDNGSNEYDSIVSFFDSNSSLLCTIEDISIDTTGGNGEIYVDSTVYSLIVSACAIDVMYYVNQGLPGNLSLVTIPDSTTAANCIGIMYEGDSIKVGFGLDSNIVNSKYPCESTDIMIFTDLDGNPVNLFYIDSIGNVSASQNNNQILYCDFYPTSGEVFSGYVSIEKCLESDTVFFVQYNPPPTPNFIEDCIDETYAQAIYDATAQYNTLLSDLVGTLLDSINCMDSIVENFKMTYELRETQYTLFYYDQAGNLVETVPPAGVDILTQGEFDAAYNYNTHEWTEGTVPDHSMQTRYEYNGANSLISQTTPDGGTTNYYYDDLYRLRFSQNAQQLLDDRFSYTKYDELGRVVEAGEAGDSYFGPIIFTDSLNNYDFPREKYRRDYVITYYETIYIDNSTLANSFTNSTQDNLRNRIGAVKSSQADYEIVGSELQPVFGTGVEMITSYSYDYYGNVKELVQTNTSLNDIGQTNKLIQYDYDLISGHVKEVKYQADSIDEWRHRYHYDANNRLVRAWTSDDGEEWEMDTKYFYYLQGHLARMEIGHDKVQGCDYEYNMQGWLRGVNSTSLQAYRDIGNDGDTLGLDIYSGVDAYGFYLGYFEGDTSNVSGSQFFANTQDLIDENGEYGSLYNGNISHMVTALKDNNEEMLDVFGNNYTYDQLNRIKSMNVFYVSDQSNFISNNDFTGYTNYKNGGYATDYWYDANGNIDSLVRNGHGDGVQLGMDNFSYHYTAGTNQLDYVEDHESSSPYSVDIQNTQTAGNYDYNGKGQLIQDTDENIDSIEWTVTGKVKKIYKSSGNDLIFYYDALGNRTMKIEIGIYNVNSVGTYYVYDASGHVLSTYKRIVFPVDGAPEDEDYQELLQLSERMIYGSKRIGVKNEHRNLVSFDFTPTSVDGDGFYQAYSSIQDTVFYPENFESEKRTVAEKSYELSNHLGNVLEVVTDQKIPNASEDGYEADVSSYSDYYPFGMEMPGRNGSASDYRYGFQGQEMDDEIKGEGNSYTARFWQYDPRLGKRWNMDIVVKEHESPYAAFANNPIWFADPFGSDTIIFNVSTILQDGPDGRQFVNTSNTVELKINTGKDVFYYNTDFTHYDIDGNVKSTSKESKEFFPNYGTTRDSKYSGITDGYFAYGVINYKHPDELALGVLAPPELLDYLIGKSEDFWTIKNYERAKYLAESYRLVVFLNSVVEIAYSWYGVNLGFKGLNFLQKSSRNLAKTEVATNIFTPINEFDPMVTLYRGISGTEATSEALYLTKDIVVAEEYAAMYGSEVMSFRVPLSTFKDLEYGGQITLKTGSLGTNGTIGTEYIVNGSELVKKFMKVGKVVK